MPDLPASTPSPYARRYRRRLRSRIVISFILLGFCLTTLFALGTYWAKIRIENQFVEDMMDRNLDASWQRYVESGGTEVVAQVQQLRAWLFRPDRLDSLRRDFPEWEHLSDGIYTLHGIEAHGRPFSYKVGVRKTNAAWFFITYDMRPILRSEQQLKRTLVLAVLVFSVLSWLLGRWSAARVMRPVSVLAERLQNYRTTTGRALEPLAPRFADDEVGQLAAALDDYALKLTEVVQRDREFNADVSHELRTPLAVIRGATELMLNAPHLEEKMRQRLQRIARAEQQCSDLIGALLLLSRNERGQGRSHVAHVAQQLLNAHQAQLGNKPLKLHLEVVHDLQVDAPEAVVSVALGNLIGNAVKYTKEGQVNIRVLEYAVEVRDTGPGLSTEDMQRLFQRGFRGTASGQSQGGGIGLSIVQRLCTLYGWQIKISANPNGGVLATLVFATAEQSKEN